MMRPAARTDIIMAGLLVVLVLRDLWARRRRRGGQTSAPSSAPSSAAAARHDVTSARLGFFRARPAELLSAQVETPSVGRGAGESLHVGSTYPHPNFVEGPFLDERVAGGDISTFAQSEVRPDEPTPTLAQSTSQGATLTPRAGPALHQGAGHQGQCFSAVLVRNLVYSFSGRRPQRRTKI